MSTTADELIKSAASVARDAAEGRLDPAALDSAVADDCRTLFGVVAGPDDALWPVHVDVSRQVLALGGIPANELTEWLAVARRREQPDAAAEATQTRAEGSYTLHAASSASGDS